MKELLARGLITKKAKWLCSACVQYSEEHFVFQNVKRRSSFEKHHLPNTEINPQCASIEDLGSSRNYNVPNECGDNVHNPDTQPRSFPQRIKDLANEIKSIRNQWNMLDFEMKVGLEELALSLGQVINLAVYHDSKSVGDQYKDLEFIDQTHPKEWTKGMNEVLVGFLAAATGVNTNSEDTSSDSTKNMNALAIEQVLCARNLHFVAPFNFLRSLVSYNITH